MIRKSSERRKVCIPEARRAAMGTYLWHLERRRGEEEWTDNGTDLTVDEFRWGHGFADNTVTILEAR